MLNLDFVSFDSFTSMFRCEVGGGGEYPDVPCGGDVLEGIPVRQVKRGGGSIPKNKGCGAPLRWLSPRKIQ